MADLTISPSRTALVNVDMQNCFVENSPVAAPGGVELLERINRLASRCRQAGILVIHVRHVLRPDGSNAGILLEIPPIREGMINQGSESAAFHRNLIIDERDILLDKPRFGAFHGTDLELLLRSRGIDTIEAVQKATCATIGFIFGKVVTIEDLNRAIPATSHVAAD
jgi:nicotinamidase-related amidase